MCSSPDSDFGKPPDIVAWRSKLKASSISSRLSYALWLLLGAALLGWLVADNGILGIVADLERVGPGIVLILALDFAMDGFKALAWWFTLAPDDRTGNYYRLFWARSAGTAVSESTPTASLGGEPAKVLLLRDRISATSATASIVAAKTCFASAQVFFVLIGMGVAWSRLTLDWKLETPLFSGFAFIAVGVAIFALLQLRGIGDGMLRALQRMRIPERRLSMIESSSHGIDARLSDFYRNRTGDVLYAIGAHFCAFACEVVQIVLLLGWLGLGYDPIAAVGIGAFSTLVSLVSFAIPGSLGAQEGGKVLIFGALGMPQSAALAVGITYRLVSLVGTASGFAAFAVLERRLRHKSGAENESGCGSRLPVSAEGRLDPAGHSAAAFTFSDALIEDAQTVLERSVTGDQ